MAKGFYEPLATRSTPRWGEGFPSEIRLHGVGSTPDVDYGVEYQFALTFRTRLYYRADDGGDPWPIVDTGLLFVYPRDEATDLIDEVDARKRMPSPVINPLNPSDIDNPFTTDVSPDLQGDSRGNFGGIDGEFPWITNTDDELHFDGVLGHKRNMRPYAVAHNPDSADHDNRLGGVWISSLGVMENLDGKDIR